MAKYVVEGGVPLRGRVKLLGAKNVGFKLLIASLLADSPSTIDNVARIRDVEAVCEIIKGLGGKAEFVSDHKVTVDPRGLNNPNVPVCQGEKTRAPTLCVGPLVARFGRAFVAAPGGDAIGQRPINRHMKGFESLGLVAEEKEGGLELRGKPRGGVYKFEKNSHTGTESLILAAVRAKGKTVIENAAAEPEVDDLIAFLNKMGAKIHRNNPRTIGIEGVEKLNGTNYQVMSDRNEAVTFACAALVTSGDIEIEGARKEHLKSFEEALQKAEATFEFSNNSLHVWRKAGTSLKATEIATAPHPGFMTDWQPLWAVVDTSASEVSTIHETVFESRFKYVESLQKMGAKIEFFDPKVKDPDSFYNFNWDRKSAAENHAIKITGPTNLQGKDLVVSDIRAGATLVLAALSAKGESSLEGIEHIERGYENLEGRLQSLGAKIRKVV
jgi:UDP-N-acetylglucosamine 1-carboxyvinyltransferase